MDHTRMFRHWLILCAALLVTVGAGKAATVDLSDRQVDELTAVLAQYRTTWAAANTRELIERADGSDVRRFGLMSDDGRRVVIEFAGDGGVWVDGESVVAGDLSAGKAGPWPYLSLVLGICLVASLLLNLRFVAAGRSHSRSRGSEVIRSISKL
jgi:hypothetical protein